MSKSDREGRSERHRFRETALASGLLEEAQITAAEHQIGLVINQRSCPAEEWDRAVSERLVCQGLLTPFQSREMLAGRRRFRLGQYTVLDEVGKGGMGRVFRAEHAMMGREVAVKVLPREKATPESEAAFRREMRMLGRLDHENLVRAFDAGFDAQVYYLVTELVPGVDLKRYVKDRGPLDETMAAYVVAQAARGLAYAHEQGLAGSELEEESSRAGRIVGTMDYIAPEQIRTPDAVGPSADVYSLGCTLYYAVTGQVPFPGGTRREKLQRHLAETPLPPNQFTPGLSDAFCRVVQDMMAKSAADRIASANAVIERLRPWIVEARKRPILMTVTGTGIGPPPLPGDAVPSARNGRQSSSSLDLLDSSSDPWPPAPVPEPSFDLFRSRDVGRKLRLAVQTLVIAAVVAVLFGFVVALVRRIDEDAFGRLMYGTSPALLGLVAFAVMVVAQVLALSLGRRSF